MHIDIVGWQPLFVRGYGGPSDVHTRTYTHIHHRMDMIAIIGTSDQSCWLAEACKILLLLHVFSVADLWP